MLCVAVMRVDLGSMSPGALWCVPGGSVREGAPRRPRVLWFCLGVLGYIILIHVVTG